MADTAAASLGKLVPGFDFLQGLMKNAGAALPGIGQWIAPTLDPKELDKRIEELRTVQFWLEQNARMLATTIQALEVQRMTLSTLQTMNVRMEDLRESMKVRLPEMPPPAPTPVAKAPPPAPVAATESGKAIESSPPSEAAATAPPAAPTPAAGAVDPMQWWVALTQQFTQLASNALKDGAQGLPPAAKATPKRAAPAAKAGAAPRKRASPPKPAKG